jgi:transposase-like protein
VRPDGRFRGPKLAIGDGALPGVGFWAAVREVWPAIDEQRCWVHKTANVLNRIPKGVAIVFEGRDSADHSRSRMIWRISSRCDGV